MNLAGSSAPCGHRQQRAHAELAHVLLFQHLAAQLVAARQRLCLIREVARGADVARQIPQVLGEVLSGPQRRTALHRRGLGPRALAGQAQRNPGERLAVVLLALELIEAIGDIGRNGCAVQQCPLAVAAFHLHLGQEQRRLRCAAVGQRSHRGAHRFAVLLGPEIGCLPEPDEEHALGRDPGHTVQQQRAAQASLQIAVREDARQVPFGCALDGLGGGGQLAALEHAGHDATALDRGRVCSFCAKLHLALRFRESIEMVRSRSKFASGHPQSQSA